jgi:hypothetical protein
MTRLFDPDCRLCEREQSDGPEGGWVYQDNWWSVGISDGFEVPGWLVAQLRRHSVGLNSLNAEELLSAGPLLARLSTAITEITGAEKVYVVAFGENFPHWHFLLMARGAQIPSEHRGPQLMLSRQQYRDYPAALKAAENMRRLLATTAAAPRSGT